MFSIRKRRFAASLAVLLSLAVVWLLIDLVSCGAPALTPPTQEVGALGAT